MFRQKFRPSPVPLKKKAFSISEEDFPDIAPASSSSAPPQKSASTTMTMDFKNCYKPEDPTALKNDRTPGWIYGFGDKNKHKIWFENDQHEVIELETPLPNDEAQSIEEIMAELYANWEKYKEEYIELFGYDEYEKMFMSPSNQYEDDCDEMDGEDTEYDEAADEYYDEYRDAYDETYYDK
jgi:hypothetical protein